MAELATTTLGDAGLEITRARRDPAVDGAIAEIAG